MFTFNMRSISCLTSNHDIFSCSLAMSGWKGGGLVVKTATGIDVGSQVD